MTFLTVIHLANVLGTLLAVQNAEPCKHVLKTCRSRILSEIAKDSEFGSPISKHAFPELGHVSWFGPFKSSKTWNLANTEIIQNTR